MYMHCVICVYTQISRAGPGENDDRRNEKHGNCSRYRRCETDRQTDFIIFCVHTDVTVTETRVLKKKKEE
jgi:hypothetical protein